MITQSKAYLEVSCWQLEWSYKNLTILETQWPNSITKVCTILVSYYIEGADQENESGFVCKRWIARLDWNYKEWYQTKLE